ncbi:hypothetical protein SH1V18_44750 [Vallitalea longa]|uniref:Leucyl aminopeptidase n=1 Tax=Vallitalea longa TaxID=2936439 RepID=A0A9W6DGU6_9FIRM|nr:aminopeptidase [Vallitalea longa]GKX31995.1 hypothetical protein SH1V18_44750 [Vallitalea longa]
MFDYNEYYLKENEPILSDYEKSIEVIKNIMFDTESKEDYGKYFNTLSKFIIMVSDHEKELNDEYFKNNTFQQLKENNYKMYVDILPSNYDTCYGNPSYAVNQFGEDLGEVLTYLYTRVFEYIRFAYQHKIFMMNRVNQLFIKFYNHMMNNDNVSIDELKKYISDDSKEFVEKEVDMYINEMANPERAYLVDMIECDDLTDLRYLFKYGLYISDNEIKIAEYLNSIPKEKVKYMADVMSEGYRVGFIRDNKDISIKSSVSLRYFVGFERVMKEVMTNFEKLNLKSIISIETSTNIEYGHTLTKLQSTSPNKQYYYDHRYDYALYLNEEYCELKTKVYEKYVEKNGKILYAQGGPALLEGFGEKPFYPKSKKECIRLNDEQTKLERVYLLKNKKILSKYFSNETYSFTYISYPIPEIGDQFEDIFDATIDVNTLDVDLYEKIQQKIIDTLDQGEYVHVKGKGTNKTDILVKLHELKNPEKETNFHNCLADVNIPLGEVYTSPTLKGTNGTLFVEEVFLAGYKYNNLEITFKDGFIDTYTCTNFDDPEANKKYMYENLIFPNETLPIGEFAIGTNTTAYVMAHKYNIENILPILITEKTGPHFAIGDTCFSWGEDIPVFNDDGKEIIARDNEKSILRKTNINEAYTGKHTDITIPYSGLASIDVITKDKERIGIIKDGRFILQGTEELNKALDEA